MWNWSDGPDGWGVVWMGLMMAVVWLPLLAIVVWALSRFGQPPHANRPPPDQKPPVTDAREIARHAYARGELDRERFLQIIEDLDRTEGATGGT